MRVECRVWLCPDSRRSRATPTPESPSLAHMRGVCGTHTHTAGTHTRARAACVCDVCGFISLSKNHLLSD